ncbi:MAG: type II secretion system F family protein [Gammaproteobacteria bacterium]|nr:type II secretion system F family protein [Gammaproteobacteria bacterium]NIM72290.1 type II secretion system F family protein [Gammaproteobacteria bacterium]NIN39800.1 type II secretion system F family protein [Gammaproteobacteria bacterium]NIO24049.1 type II secretion system F family protein [Gammaproteobacteria bacterium]NIO64699.1 type II secretion system F family protein [Gammaproteobacteria bacterium]
MPVFHYKAANISGDVVQGEMEAASLDAVIRQLQAQGHIPIRAEEISGAGPAEASPAFSFSRRRAGRAEVSVFTIELATLLQAGLPLDRALETLVGIADRTPFRDVLEALLADVRGGAFLSAALESHGRLFSRFYRNMVKAGEASGALDAALARLAEFMERSRELRDSILSALLYPMVLVFVGIVSMAIILGLVIPKISAMFDEAGQQLPWFTQVVVSTGHFVQVYWWVMALAAAAIYILLRRQYAEAASRLRWDSRMLRAPLVGPLIARLEAARFTRTLGTLLGNGVPLLDAIAIAKEVVSNRFIANGIGRVAERVRQGEGLARPLSEARVFPPLAGHLLQVGEESGNLENMLMQLAQIYEREVKSALGRLMAVLEPALIIGLAVIIAAIILSIVVAILSINNLTF